MRIMDGHLPAQCFVIGGQIAYKIVQAKETGIPLVVVHGGPGTPHNYLMSLTDLLPNQPIIFYDQLGCGMSSSANDWHYWQLERFVDEIEKLRAHLGLQQFNLYAHSAGTMYAFDYALAAPDIISKLILASPILSVQAYLQGMRELLLTFPDSLKQVILAAMEEGASESYALMEANTYFAEHHLCRLAIWPDDLLYSAINTNVQLRNYMWGSNDFFVTGILKSYERLSSLAKLKVKTLVTVGEYDFVRPETCGHYVAGMPNAQLAIIPKASHHPHLEQPDAYSEILRAWLRV